MLDQERQTSSLGRTPWITSFHLSERKLFSSPLDLLLFLLCNSGTGPSPLGSANCFSGGGISDIWLSWTWAVVLPFYKEYFVMLKESWMFDMVSAFKNHVIFYCFFFFFLFTFMFSFFLPKCDPRKKLRYHQIQCGQITFFHLSSMLKWDRNFSDLMLFWGSLILSRGSVASS